MNKNLNMAAAICIALLGAGCASHFAPVFEPPPVSEYYKGESPNFGASANPDPLGRKFRIGNIWFDRSMCGNISFKDSMEGDIQRVVALNFMPLREQAKDSPAFTGLSTELASALRNYCIYSFNSYLYDQDIASNPRKYWIRSGTIPSFIGNKADLDFLAGYPSKDWIRQLNNELASRYPSLFATADDAFPIDMALEMEYDGVGTFRKESLYEAWVLGLPQHGALTMDDCKTNGKIFKAEEGFTNPYDAIAAALFKVSAPQWEEVQPSNPNDFAWLNCDLAVPEITRQLLNAKQQRDDLLNQERR